VSKRHFNLFPKLTEFTKGREFLDDEHKWLAMEDQDQEFFYSGIRDMEKPWQSALLLEETMLKSDNTRYIPVTGRYSDGRHYDI